MSIRPIDLITIAPKSQEASTQQFAGEKRIEHMQQQAGATFGKKVAQNQEKTVQTNKSEQQDYRYDPREKGNSSYEEQHSQKKKRQKKQDDKASSKQGHFDITI